MGILQGFKFLVDSYSMPRERASLYNVMRSITITGEMYKIILPIYIILGHEIIRISISMLNKNQ